MILLTGFEPFRQWRVNSSWEAVRRLERPGVVVARLPVDHHAAAEAVRRLIAEVRPEAVLLTGLAAGAACRLELFGRPGPLEPQAPLRRGRWPVARSLAALRARAVPGRLSRDAGGYVCDTTYWAALGQPGPRLCLFLHVPPLGSAWTGERLGRAVGAVLAAGRDALSAPAAG